MFERLYHHRSSNERSHNSRHDCDTPGRNRTHDPSFSQSLPFLGCFCGTFSPSRRHSRSIQPFNTAIADGATCLSKQCCNPAITVSAKLSGQLDHIRNEPVFISVTFRDMSLCRAVLPQHSTRSPFRGFELAAHMINASTTTSGAQKFPLAVSFKINLSSVKSDTALLSCSFSFWRRFSSFN